MCYILWFSSYHVIKYKLWIHGDDGTNFKNILNQQKIVITSLIHGITLLSKWNDKINKLLIFKLNGFYKDELILSKIVKMNNKYIKKKGDKIIIQNVQSEVVHRQIPNTDKFVHNLPFIYSANTSSLRHYIKSHYERNKIISKITN